MNPHSTIRAFDAFLSARDLTLEAIVVGGAALGLLGVISRPTRDCDVLHPLVPEPVSRAAVEFALERRLAGEALADDWLNNGPSSLVLDLPLGWERRLQVAYEGTAIRLRTLGRPDLLRSKVFALCDRAIDLPDCIALEPTREELHELLPWLEERDANPQWPAHLRAVVADLSRKLGHVL